MSVPIALYASAAVRASDARAIAGQGIPAYTLMERAAAAALSALRVRFAVARDLCVLAGSGNNGGDGYVLARLAQQQGFTPRVIAVGKVATTGESGAASDAWRAAAECAAAGVPILALATVDLARELQSADLIVDALLGIGLKESVREPMASVIDAINAAQRPVLSLDVPSGLCADTGRVAGVAVRADLTVTFVAAKKGLWLEQGVQLAGEIFFDDLGVEPPQERACLERLHPTALALALPLRPREAHKGDFGHVMVLGGGPGMPGAARLAAEAALRVGAGKVTVLCHRDSVDAIAAGRAELMVRAIDTADALHEALRHCDLLALGPGLGRSEWAQALWTSALDSALPKVIDADALNLLAEHRAAGRARIASAASHWILTPHPGEAARLLGTDSATVQADRLTALQRLQAAYGGICILKGAGTLIGRGDRPPAICDRGNPAMAAPGMGDVLTGMLAGLWVQCEDEALAAAAAVWWHAAAGDHAAKSGPVGGGVLLAGDVLEALAATLDVVRRQGATELPA
jgi:NAD(P)H-hydrate epimerase